MPAERPISVLFLGSHNSVRSQMAEAFLRQHAGERFQVQSAGMVSAGIHPLTIAVMREIGHDLSGQRSKSATEFLGRASFTFVISVCDQAHEECPRMFPGALCYLRWPFPDPVSMEVQEPRRIERFRTTRDEIKARIDTWVALPETTTPPPGPLLPG